MKWKFTRFYWIAKYFVCECSRYSNRTHLIRWEVHTECIAFLILQNIHFVVIIKFKCKFFFFHLHVIETTMLKKLTFIRWGWRHFYFVICVFSQLVSIQMNNSNVLEELSKNRYCINLTAVSLLFSILHFSFYSQIYLFGMDTMSQCFNSCWCKTKICTARLQIIITI